MSRFCLVLMYFFSYHLTFRSLLHYSRLLVSHSIFLGHWLPSSSMDAFSISVHQQALYTSLHLTACCSVGYHFHTHLNMLPQFFFLDSFSFNYFVRSTWFNSCFVLKQKYFTRLKVSDPVPHFPCLPPLLRLKVPEIS